MTPFKLDYNRRDLYKFGTMELGEVRIYPVDPYVLRPAMHAWRRRHGHRATFRTKLIDRFPEALWTRVERID